MFKSYSALSLICLASLLFGCQAATDSQTSARPAGTAPGESGENQDSVSNLTLVKLKVPNMT